MHKPANRILSMVLALIMVVSMLPATVFAAGEAEESNVRWNLSLGDNIGVKFHLDEVDYDAVSVTVNGAAANFTESEKVVTVNVAAAQMNDPIVLTVKKGDQTVHSGEYSVRKYAEIIMNGGYDAEVKSMVKYMLNYGAAAQTYFGHDANNLANAGYELENAAEVPSGEYGAEVNGIVKGVVCYGNSLLFQSKTALRFYFQINGNIADYTFSVDGVNVEPDKKEDLYYVQINGINPQDLANDYSVQVSNANGDTLTFTYSPMDYIGRKYHSDASSASLKGLMSVMYGYYQEALNYREYQKITQLGTLSAHADPNPWVVNEQKMYLKAMMNVAVPVSGDYRPLSEDAVKLVRNGVTYNVGKVGVNTLVLQDDNQCLINISPETIGDLFPLQAHDYLIIEGRFDFWRGEKVQIGKTYVYYDGSKVAVSATEPTLPTTINAGVMQTHPEGVLGNGIRFRMDANDAPMGWGVEFKQTATSNIKLIRNGATTDIGIVGRPLLIKYDQIDYYLKLEGWTIGAYGWNDQSSPITTDDILIIEGDFVYETDKVTLHVTKSYVYYDGSAWVCSATEPVEDTIYEAGAMTLGTEYGTNGMDIADNGMNIYGVTNANGAPGDSWSYEYTPTDSANLKLIRDGVTYNVGNPGQGTIVKFNETGFCIKLYPWTVANGKMPMVAGDLLIVEGEYYLLSDSTKIINFATTYILFNEDGTVSVSATEPVEDTIYEAGAMTLGTEYGTNGMDIADNGMNIYGVTNANGAPGDSWSYEYTPTDSANLKLIRDGVTYNVGNPGQGTIVKFNETGFCIKLYPWTVANGKMPMVAGDLLIVEGEYYLLSDSIKIINFATTYILFNEDGTVSLSATEPVPEVVVDCGNMSAHADGSPEEIYFSLAENAAPVDEELVYPYVGTVQMVNGSNVSTVNANIYKLDSNAYYLELDGAELADGSYLIVEGEFVNAENHHTLNIAKTYVLAKDGELVYSTTEPVMETEYALTGLTNHPNGWTAGGIYISHDAHEATIGTDWSVRYRPVSAEVIKLVRGGETFNIGQPAGDTLVVYGNTNMYFETKAWTTQGGKLPFVDGDQIIIEGKFKHEASGDILVVEKTTIHIHNGNLIFNAIEAGTLSNHANGAGGDGVYANMAANSVPYVTDWSTELTPKYEASYRVIRDGVETNIGMPGRGTLVKYGETDYYLKHSGWCLNGFTAQTTDIFVIEGFWMDKNDNSIVVKIEKTYLYHDGSAWTFATELPTIVNGGVMQTHGTGMSGTGIYFTMDSNEAPYKADWSLEYTQTSVDGIKLIRNGETISIGIVGRPLFVKTSDVQYYLKLEGWTIGEYGLDKSSPITTDDILIVEGNFEYAAQNVTLNISKSYVYYDGSAWVCSAEAPEQKNIVDVTGIAPAENGWTSGGFYFVAAENNAPMNTDWSLRYKPLTADAIKLVHDGVTTNKGNTGAETIVKYGETKYYIEGWAIGMSSVVAGDQLIIDGMFYNAANDTYIKVEKTTITFNENGTISCMADSAKYIKAGAMSAYTQNWFGAENDTEHKALYFTLASNIAPANSDWNVRYTPTAAANVKLIRDGETFTIGNTGAETIAKIEDGVYVLALDAWWWSTYAPIQEGDVLIIEGDFANASNGYTLNISKTYITIGAFAEDEVTFSTANDTEFGDVLLPNSTKTMKIGMWNGSYHAFDNKQLQELKDAGITKIMGIDPMWLGTTDVKGWLDRVHSYGISVILEMRNWDGTANYTWLNNNGDPVCSLNDIMDHPAIIGFLMFDEPCATDFANLATLKTKFDDVMPADKLFYVNLFPSCAAGTSLVGALDWALGRRDYDQYYVTQFLKTVLGIEVLSWDNYSLLDGQGIRTDYFYNFEVMAGKENVTPWYTMLSSGHNTTSTSYAIPTEEELRWQMAVAMTYGVSNIDHYTYVSHEEDYSCMVEYGTWNPTDLYYDIKKVDNEFLGWDNIYMAYDWIGVGVHDTGSNNTMLNSLNNKLNLANYGISATASDENLLIGVFSYNNTNAYMVTNAGGAGNNKVGDGKNFIMDDATVTLTLDGSYKCVAVIANGEISYVAVEGNTVTFDVAAYGYAFVIPVAN